MPPVSSIRNFCDRKFGFPKTCRIITQLMGQNLSNINKLVAIKTSCYSGRDNTHREHTKVGVGAQFASQSKQRIEECVTAEPISDLNVLEATSIALQ